MIPRYTKLFIFTLAFVMLAGSAFATHFVVRTPDAEPGEYPTIQEAVDLAINVNDSIRVIGTFNENVTVPNNGILIYALDCEGGNDGAGLKGGYGFHVTGSNVTISGLEIFNFDQGIRVETGTAGTFSDNWFHDNTYGMVIKSGSTGNNTYDNCFYFNTTNAYDENAHPANTWADNSWDDWDFTTTYYTIAPGPAYDLTPAGGTATNTASGPALVPYGTNATYEFTFCPTPVCVCSDGTQIQYLRLAEFTVTWDDAVFEFVGRSPGTATWTDGDGYYTTYPLDAADITNYLTFTAWSNTGYLEGCGMLGDLELKAIGIPGSLSDITISSAYHDQDNQDIATASINLIDVEVSDIYDPTCAIAANPVGGPFGDDTYNSSNDVALDIDVTDEFDLGKTTWEIVGPPDYGPFDVAGLDFTGYPPPDLSGSVVAASYGGSGGIPDGAYRMDVIVYDEYGNSSTCPYDFFVDNTPPVFTCDGVVDANACGKPGFTDGPVLIQTTTADADVSQIEVEYRLAGWVAGGTFAYAADLPFDMTGFTDGLYDFRVKLHDIHGNVSGWCTMNNVITLDQILCTTAGWDITPPKGTSYTGIPWTITQFCGPTAYAWMVTEDAADLVCGNPNWIVGSYVYSGTFDFTDPGVTCATLTLYVGAMDEGGNITVTSDTYVYDVKAPRIRNLVITDQSDGGDDCTDNATVDVSFEYKGDVCDNQLALYVGNDAGVYTMNSGWIASPTSWTPYTFSFPITWVLGTQDVFVAARDDLSNWSAEYTDDIWVDGTPPTFTDFKARDLDFPAAPYPDDAPIDPQWSNSADINGHFFNVTESGPTVDFVMAEDGAFTVNVQTVTVAGPIAGDVIVPYASSGVEGVTLPVFGKIVDCAGNASGVDTDGIDFDFPPKDMASISAFDAVSSPTNTLGPNSFSFIATDLVSGVYQSKIYEKGFQSSESWSPDVTSPNDLPLLEDLGPPDSNNDGPRIVRLRVSDMAGNITAASECTIDVDMSLPCGTIDDIVSLDIPAPAPGYTCGDAANVTVTPTEPVQRIKVYVDGVKQADVSGLPPAQPILTSPLGGYGNHVITVKFQDLAGNWSDFVSCPVSGSIFRDCVPPAAPAPGDVNPDHGSSIACRVDYDLLADIWFYRIVYVRLGGNPEYEGDPPGYPGFGDKFFVADIDQSAATGSYIFDGATDDHPDIYYFSVFAVDSAHNVSAAMNDSATNYFLGDVDYDDDMSFVKSKDGGTGDFAALSAAYYLDSSDPNWLGVDGHAHCDFAPDGRDACGIPEPNDLVDYNDAAIAIMNYRVQHVYGVCECPLPPSIPKMSPVEPVMIAAALPDRLSANEEYTITFTADNPADIMMMHMVFNFDNENLDIVKVQPGEMFNTSAKTFFYKNVEGNELLIDCASIDVNGFTENEIAQVTVRANNDISEFEFEDAVLDLRDGANRDIEVAFNSTVEKTVVIPTEFALYQNYPNPFNPATTIKLALPTASNYTVGIFNVAGQRVASFSGYSEAGIVSVTWDASDAASGVYFYKAEAGTFEATRKMVLIK